MRKQEIALRRPAADPFHLGDLGNGGFILQIVQDAQIQITADQQLGKGSAIGFLLTAETDGGEILLRQLQESLRRHGVAVCGETVPDRLCRGNRDLLTNDDAHEGVKAGGTGAQGWRPHVLQRARHIAVQRRQLLQRAGQRFRGNDEALRERLVVYRNVARPVSGNTVGARRAVQMHEVLPAGGSFDNR